MGFYQEEMNKIIFDTGSSFLVLNTIDCTDCATSYDYTTSAAASAYTNIGTAMTQTYGDGTTITGELAQDWVCMSSDSASCATDY